LRLSFQQPANNVKLQSGKLPRGEIGGILLSAVFFEEFNRLRGEKCFQFFEVDRTEQINFELGHIVRKFLRLGEGDGKIVFIEAGVLGLGQFYQPLHRDAADFYDAINVDKIALLCTAEKSEEFAGRDVGKTMYP
jgi:hypothetical protein